MGAIVGKGHRSILERATVFPLQINIHLNNELDVITSSSSVITINLHALASQIHSVRQVNEMQNIQGLAHGRG